MSSQDALDIGKTGLLSEATLSALQINQQPFTPHQGGSEAGNELFSDEVTAEQLADIKQALITGDDLLLILGEDGAGKTTLLSQLGVNSGLRIQCFAVKGSSRFSTMNLFAGMLEAFKRKPPETLKQILDELIPCLQTMVARNTLSAIALDDAHKVNATELTQLLSGMLYVNSQDETLMRVALTAPSDFEDQIPDLLPEGADLPYSSLTIDGLSPSRASAYVELRLAQAGFADEFPFTDNDMADLVDQSAGLPTDLHAVIADNLNKRHGLVEHSLPPELVETESTDSFMHSRFGKLALGALASVLIVAGLTLFMRHGSDQDNNRYTVASQNSAETAGSDNQLKLLKDETDIVSDETEVQTPVAPEPKPIEPLVTATPRIEIPVPEPAQEPIPEPIPEQVGADEPVQEAVDVVAEELIEEPGVDVAENNAPDEQPTEQPTEQSAEQADTAAIPPESSAKDPVATAQQGDTDTTEAEDATKAPGFLESPNWILVQNADQYTVQMSASRDLASVENFLKKNSLSPPNSIFSFDRDGNTWYALLHGLFPTIDDARLSVERMPATAQTNQPWIRSVGRIQNVLKAQ